MLWLAAMFQAYAQTDPLARMQIESLDLLEVASDRVRVALHLSGTADRSFTIRDLVIDGAAVNGVPVYLGGIHGRRTLRRGQPFSDIGKLEATVYFRDLETLEPLRRAVTEGKAQVRAVFRSVPELTWTQKILLWTTSAWLPHVFERTVPVVLPGGTLGRGAALLALTAADSVWVFGRKGVEWRSRRDSFVEETTTRFAPYVVQVAASKRLLRPDGRSSEIHWRGLGWLEEDGSVVTTAEAVEPWSFDVAVAEAVHKGEVQLAPGDAQVVVRTQSAQGWASEQRATIRAVGNGHDRAISTARRKVFRFRRRDAGSNVALLSVAAAARGAVVNNSQAAIEAGPQNVAVFRFRSDRNASLEVLVVPAAVEQDRIRLLEPIDARAWGSPVVVGTSVAGILVDQTTVVPISEARRLADPPGSARSLQSP